MTLGERIKKRREELGMTQRDLAAEVCKRDRKCSAHDVWRWENRNTPDLENLIAVADALGETIDSLTEGNPVSTGTEG